MATKNFVPRGNNEGKLGTFAYRWNEVHSDKIYIGDGTNAGTTSSTNYYLTVDSTGKVVVNETRERSSVVPEDNAHKIVSLNEKGSLDQTILPNNCLKVWQAETHYYIDDAVIKDNKLYRCQTETSKNYFDETDWVQLTGYLTDTNIITHMSAEVESGIHGMPIATTSDNKKVLAIDDTGHYTLVNPGDLGLAIQNVGPNAPEIYTPAVYSAVSQPTTFDMGYFHPLGTASAGVIIDVFEENASDHSLKPVFSTDWLPPVSTWKLPYGLLDYSNWYVAKVKCRDVSGRVSEERTVRFKSLPSNLFEFQFGRFIKEYGIDGTIGLSLDGTFVLLEHYKMSDQLVYAGVPLTPNITTNVSSFFVSDQYTVRKFTDVEFEYSHSNGVALSRIITRFFDPHTSQYLDSIEYYSSIPKAQIYQEHLEPNKDLILEVIAIDVNGNSKSTSLPCKTYSITHLHGTRTQQNELQISSVDAPIFSLAVPSQNAKNLVTPIKPNVPVISNPSDFVNMPCNDGVSINYATTLNFSYSHPTESSMSRCLTRFVKQDGSRIGSTVFFGSGNSIDVDITSLEPNNQYTMELYVMDESLNSNIVTFPATTMPSGQYVTDPYKYSMTDNATTTGTGVLTLYR